MGKEILHFLLYNGIGQNVTASLLIGVPSIIFGWKKILPRIKEHERKVHELHAYLTHPRKETRGG